MTDSFWYPSVEDVLDSVVEAQVERVDLEALAARAQVELVDQPGGDQRVILFEDEGVLFKRQGAKNAKIKYSRLK